MNFFNKTIIYILSFSIFFLIFSGCSPKKKYKKGTPATMKTYCVRGKTYNPTYVSVGKKSRGVSSWYGSKFHGRRTSNGERYNMYGFTAAHKTWPMNTMVRVTNLKSKKSTVVRINDRGPFVRGRIIDCSYAAGKSIGLHHSGVAKVQVEVIGFKGKIYKPVVVKRDLPTEVARDVKEVVIPREQQRIKLSNFGIRVGAFSKKSGATIYQRHYAILNTQYKSIIKESYDKSGDILYSVWIMGFGSEEEAEDYKYCNDLEEAVIVRE